MLGNSLELRTIYRITIEANTSKLLIGIDIPLEPINPKDLVSKGKKQL